MDIATIIGIVIGAIFGIPMLVCAILEPPIYYISEEDKLKETRRKKLKKIKKIWYFKN